MELNRGRVTISPGVSVKWLAGQYPVEMRRTAAQIRATVRIRQGALAARAIDDAAWHRLRMRPVIDDAHSVDPDIADPDR